MADGAGIPCVIYAAKSTEDKRGSIPEQLRECREAIDTDPLRRFVDEFEDESSLCFLVARDVALTAAGLWLARRLGPTMSGTVCAMPRGIVAALAASLCLCVAACGSSGGKHASTGQGSNQPPLTGSRVVLVYRARAGAQPVTAASLNQTIRIMRKRVASINAVADIRRSGRNAITVTLPRDAKSAGTEPLVSTTAELLFYDWEPNVIGADAKPAPSEATVTGGQDAGAAQFGLPEYQAVLRAEKLAPELRTADTTWSKGCTPQQIGGCSYGSWYLLEPEREKVLRGPEEAKKSLYLGHEASHGVNAVRVNPGAVLVRARALESASGVITDKSPNSWYVIKDNPVLTGADIKNPEQGFDEGAGGTGAANVTFDFSSHGRTAFERVSKEIAHRGQESELPGVGKEAAEQHFAVVLDGQLVTTPAIDYVHYPEGIDASSGSQISGGFTTTSAQELADELRAGELPLRLILVSQTRY